MAKMVLPKKLHSHFYTICAEGSVEEMRALFEEHSIDSSAQFFKPDNSCRYGHPLFLEIFSSAEPAELLSFFISKKVDLSLTGHGDQNILWKLPMNETGIQLLNLLIEAGIAVDQPDEDGTTFLCSTVREYGDRTAYDSQEYQPDPAIYLRMIETLLQNGADPELQNRYGSSARDWVNHRLEEGDSDRTVETLLNRYSKAV